MSDPFYDARKLCTRHLQFAWWSLLCFVTLGITLEALHGFKMDWYLGQSTQMRRLMWTLAHAHGTLLALVHAAFAFTYLSTPRRITRSPRVASALLMAASVLLPGGFFLGGAFIFEGDPGLGVWLVPPGALCLFGAVLLTAIDTLGGSEPPHADKEPRPNQEPRPE